MVPEGHADRLDRIVRDVVEGSLADARGLLHHGCVSINGITCDEPERRIDAGASVTIRRDVARRYRAPAFARERANSAFKLIHEDAEVIVVDKAAALLTVPTDRGETNTLIDAINQHLKRTGRRKATCVHRLDRGTSGLLVFAKTPQAARSLRDQFRQHDCLREYRALVAGHVAPQTGTIRTKLQTAKSLRRYSGKDEEPGETAITHYRVLKHLTGATLLSITLETGRRNQIRVHFAERGHPVLGDDRYGDDHAQHRNWTARRLALHACVLGFAHPRTGKPLRFESPLPPEFERFVERSG